MIIILLTTKKLYDKDRFIDLFKKYIDLIYGLCIILNNLYHYK